jgi:hypothetical protein
MRTRLAEASALALPVPPAVRGIGLDPAARAVYVRALRILRSAGVDFLVGGAHALGPYTGVFRDTKDLDVFLRPGDCPRALAALGQAGFETEVTFPHWLAKAFEGEWFIDLIYSSGNGVARVDDQWFVSAGRGEVLGQPVLLCPPEEMIWSKAFIMERERYDGADVAHLIRACGARMDWDRLVARFGRRWRVLLSHLVLFGFIYPGERALVPDAVLARLLRRLRGERRAPPGGPRVCEGTVISREQYLMDVTREGYQDGRLAPRGEMTAAEIAQWTAAIEQEPSCRPPRSRSTSLRRGAGARRRGR